MLFVAPALRKKNHPCQPEASKLFSSLLRNALSEAKPHTCLDTQLKKRSLSMCLISKICFSPLTIFYNGVIDDSDFIRGNLLLMTPPGELICTAKGTSAPLELCKS